MQTIITGALAALFPYAGTVSAPTVQALTTADAGPAAGVEGVPLTEEFEGRIFDLRGLSLAAPLNPFSSRTSVLLPLLRAIINENGESHVAEPNEMNLEGRPAEALVEAFMETLQGDSEFEMVEVLEGGLVYLVGPSKLLDQFDAFVEHVGAALISNPTLEILEFQVSDEDASALPEGISLSGQVERARLRAWLSGGLEFSERQVLLAGGGIHMVSNLESHTVTTALEAQIAQASAIFKPKVFDAVVGSELTLSGYRSGDGVLLRYMAMSTELREAEDPRRYTVEGRYFSDEGRPYFDTSEAWSDDFGMAGGHSIGSAKIDTSSYLMLSVGTSQGHLRCIAISLDPDSAEQPSVSRIETSGELEIVAVPLGLMQPAQLDMEWENYRRMSTLEHNATDVVGTGDWTLQATAQLQDASLFSLMLENVELFGDYHLPGSALLVVQETDADRVEEMANLAAPGTTYHVSVMSQDPTGRQLQRGSVSIEAGTVGALVSGYEQLIAKGADVEVAQFSATRQPVPNTHFDGLVLTIKLGAAPDGSLLYGLRGQMATDLSVADGPSKLTADSALTAVTASQLFIHESGTAAAAGEPGTWTIVVGDETQAGAFVKLTISAE